MRCTSSLASYGVVVEEIQSAIRKGYTVSWPQHSGGRMSQEVYVEYFENKVLIRRSEMFSDDGTPIHADLTLKIMLSRECTSPMDTAYYFARKRAEQIAYGMPIYDLVEEKRNFMEGWR